MMEVMRASGVFLLYAVTAIFAENAVFGRAMGVSRLVKLVDDSTVDTLTFGGLMCLIQLISAPLAYLVNGWIQPYSWRSAVRPLAFLLCSTVAFFIVLALVLFLLKDKARQILAVLPMATFNTAVLGMMLITTTQSFTLLQTMGFALGSGIGYLAAVLVVTEGDRKMKNGMVPASFRGLPITLIYIGILALAIYGFTGHRISIG